MKQYMPSAVASSKPQFPKLFSGQYGSEISAYHLILLKLFILVSGMEILRHLCFKDLLEVFLVRKY